MSDNLRLTDNTVLWDDEVIMTVVAGKEHVAQRIVEHAQLVASLRNPRIPNGVVFVHGMTISKVVDQITLWTVRGTSGNVHQAALLLGISPRTLYNRLKSMRQRGINVDLWIHAPTPEGLL